MLKATIVLLALVGIAFAAFSIKRLEPKPKELENVEGCYISELKDVIPFGQAKPSPTSCEEYRCQKTRVKIVSCGSVKAKYPYCIVQDSTKQYPECCPKIVKCFYTDDLELFE